MWINIRKTVGGFAPQFLKMQVITIWLNKEEKWAEIGKKRFTTAEELLSFIGQKSSKVVIKINLV